MLFGMAISFKEWAIVVDALGRGEQILILRKGGIAEGRGGFKVEHERFLLFPTLFHQQGESVIPSAKARYDEIAPGLPGKETLRLEYWAEVVSWKLVDSLDAAKRLAGQHIWQDEVIADRFDWGRSQGIYALALRIHKLPERVEIPMKDEYGGCKSWVDVACAIPEEPAPVLSDEAFAEKLKALEGALDTVAS